MRNEIYLKCLSDHQGGAFSILAVKNRESYSLDYWYDEKKDIDR